MHCSIELHFLVYLYVTLQSIQFLIFLISDQHHNMHARPHFHSLSVVIYNKPILVWNARLWLARIYFYNDVYVSTKILALVVCLMDDSFLNQNRYFLLKAFNLLKKSRWVSSSKKGGGGGYSEFVFYESYKTESQRDLKITHVENIISQNQLLFSMKVIININPKYTWVFLFFKNISKGK